MEELPTDLIFSIFLMCHNMKDMTHLMLLNKHWFGVSQLEAVWRMRFSYFIDDRIRSEEEKLFTNTTTTPEQRESMRRKSKGIKKLLDLRKSHVEEVEKLYNRQICKLEEGTNNNTDDFYCGRRFYTIFKKVVLSFISQRHAETTRMLITQPLGITPDTIDPLVAVSSMIEKWKKVIEHAEKVLQQAGTTTNNENVEQLQYDGGQLYDINKDRDSTKLIAEFEKDYGRMRPELKIRIKTTSEEAMKTFWEINSQLIEPMRILTDGKIFKHPLDGLLVLELAVKTMDFEFVRGILDHLVETVNNNGKSTTAMQKFNRNHTDTIQYGTRIMGLLMERSYAVEEIMYFLKCFTVLFPSVMDKISNQTKQAQQLLSPFKCDEDLLAYHFINHSLFSHSTMLCSLELFEKAITDWNYPGKGINFVEHILERYRYFTIRIDYYYSFRKEQFTVKHLIHLIELYERQTGKVMITDEIVSSYVKQGKLEMVKYFCDVRGFKLVNNDSLPLVYQYLKACNQSGDEIAEMLGYLASKIEGDFYSERGDRDVINPLDRMVRCFYNGQGNHELWLNVFQQLLKRKPSPKVVKLVIRDIDGSAFQHVNDLLRMLRNYIKSYNTKKQ